MVYVQTYDKNDRNIITGEVKFNDTFNAIDMEGMIFAITLTDEEKDILRAPKVPVDSELIEDPYTSIQMAIYAAITIQVPEIKCISCQWDYDNDISIAEEAPLSRS